jgi:predicted CopG family antitoxin
MKQVKVSEDVYEQLQKIADKSGGISINDVVKMLLNLYLGGSSERTIDKILTKEFIADREVVCSKCKKTIGIGEVVYWVKYVFSDGSKSTRYFCFECANPSLGKIYRKKRELEVVIKQLKQEADRLAEEINQLEQVKAVLDIKKELIQFWRDIKTTFINDPNLQKVDMFFDKLNELLDKVNRLEAMVKSIVEPIKTKAKKKEVLTEEHIKERVL